MRDLLHGSLASDETLIAYPYPFEPWSFYVDGRVKASSICTGCLTASEQRLLCEQIEIGINCRKSSRSRSSPGIRQRNRNWTRIRVSLTRTAAMRSVVYCCNAQRIRADLNFSPLLSGLDSCGQPLASACVGDGTHTYDGTLPIELQLTTRSHLPICSMRVAPF